MRPSRASSTDAASACRNKSAAVRGLRSCAEEDPNLHPVIPDQGLNLVTRVSYPSQIAPDRPYRPEARTIWTHRTVWMLPRMLPVEWDRSLDDSRVCGVGVARLVDDEPPVAAPWPRGSEVREVECEDRKIMPFGAGHDGSVGEAEVEIGEARVELDSAAKQAGREEGDRVLASRYRVEEEPRRVRADARAKELVDLDEYRVRYEEIASELADQGRRERVRLIAAVGGGDERARVGDDPQAVVTGARR